MGRRLAKLATCNINQWALDFAGNIARIKKSIVACRQQGATYRVGPELEVTGYGCEDHFMEQDTIDHSWEAVLELLQEGYTQNLLCDVGMPIMHRGVRYNCRVFLLNGKVLLIRPKQALANDGNYRETRYFATWKRERQVDEHSLPASVREATGQAACPFGDGVLACNDALLASETCEELFTPKAPHIDLALSGVEIISNGSGSHHQLRKLHQRLDLIRSATAKAGGVYLYANQRGCDGGRLYYDGCACIAINGELVAQASQFSLHDVEVVAATVSLEDVVSYRGAMASFQEQASSQPYLCLIKVDFSLCQSSLSCLPSPMLSPSYVCAEEEIARGPACWLWDYLRRSGSSGFLLPLSGGADSSSTAAIVGTMCQMAVKEAQQGNQTVLEDMQRITGTDVPTSAEALAQRLFVTVYMGTENSTQMTRDRAHRLSSQIGAYHLDVRIDSIVHALITLFVTITGKTPRYRVDGGSTAENLALQNIQARLRMVLAFLLAQLLPWVRGHGNGWLLVLGSANVDECLRGYLTKYDCSSADINPIGGISKCDLRRFLLWGSHNLGYPELSVVYAAEPSAELEPIREGVAPQTDEADMGMTYEDLTLYGRLRKISRCGPVTMFLQLLVTWKDKLPPANIAAKVKKFFYYYAINRHKGTVITPSYHAESYSPDDNRFDLRQFLYNARWPWQFKCIDQLVLQIEGSNAQRGKN